MRFWLSLAALPFAVAWAQGQTTNQSLIDLPTALRLAGAQNLDVQIARRALQEAEANRTSAVEQFFPWIAPGVGYHRRDGLAQAVPAGTVSAADFQSYAPGGTLTAQVALGDAIYNSLAAKQLVRASTQALEAQRQDAILSAAQGYFELAKALALVGVAQQAVATSRDYQDQLHAAVQAGIAFKGDELRVQTQTERYQIAVRQAREQQRLAAVNLAQTLHLDPAIELVPRESGLEAVTLFETNAPLAPLVQRALGARPELRQSQALIAAARQNQNGAVYGPLIPSLGVQAFAGGFGGGPDHGPGVFGSTEDYLVGASWRIGPGGLFDVGRRKATQARLAEAQLGETKLKDAVIAQVVAALTRVQSAWDQMALGQRNLDSASETLRLTRQRKQYGVGIVLEDLQAQQALFQARADYLAFVAAFNQAQYALSQAVGGSGSATAPSTASPK